MSADSKQKLVERNIPGTGNRSQRFAEVEHAENVGSTLKRIASYFYRRKKDSLVYACGGYFWNHFRNLCTEPAKQCH